MACPPDKYVVSSSLLWRPFFLCTAAAAEGEVQTGCGGGGAARRSPRAGRPAMRKDRGDLLSLFGQGSELHLCFIRSNDNSRVSVSPAAGFA